MTTSDLAVELYTGATTGWVRPSVYTRSTMTINRGNANESTSASPSTCSCQIDNRSRNWDPRNATGLYYGQIGKGTPMRVALTTITDLFARVVANGWGNAPGGQAWSTGSNGGTSADFAVTGTAATHSVTGTASYRYTVLAESYKDVDVRIDVSVLPSVNVAGGQIEPSNIMLRYQSSTSYYMVRLAIATDQTVNIGLQHVDGSIIANQVTIAGLTHAGNNVLRIRAQAEGQSLRAKVWDTSQPEPYGWQVSGNYYDQNKTQINTAGQIGVRSGVGPGNTNPDPVVFSYTNLVVSSPRFAGEVGEFKQGSDLSNQDKYVDIDGGGILRRLGQGAAPLQSTLRRSVPTLTSLVTYWPCEDGANAAQLASGLTGGSPMALTAPAQLAASSAFSCSAPLLTLQSGGLSGAVPTYPATGAAQVRFLLDLSSAPADLTILCRMTTGGSLVQWDWSYTVGGGLNLRVYDTFGNNVLDSTIGFGVVLNTPYRFSMQANNSGSSVAYTVSIYQQNSPLAAYSSGTISSANITAVTSVTIAPAGGLSGATIGHITAENASTDIFTLAPQFNAYVGEDCLTRMSRLCGENNVPFDYVGDPSRSALPALMGPQLVDTLLNLLNEAATADLGQLTESRGTSGLFYATLGAHYNQPAALTLNASAGDLCAPPLPVDDDQQTHNDVTVTRRSGSSSHATLTTGRLSTLPPGQGGIGTYASSSTVNVEFDTQLFDIAGWLLHLGTIDAARYPALPLRSTRPPNATGRVKYLAMLAVTMPNKIQVNNLNPDPVLAMVRGYTETLSPFLIEIQCNCAPAAPFETVVLDDGVSKWDSDTTTLHAPIGTTDTSFQVDIGDGTLWTTSSADWPLSLQISGEHVSVGAISGTSSPQTFSSVTRSTNGVVKSHSVGEKIRLARPAYLSLGRPS